MRCLASCPQPARCLQVEPLFNGIKIPESLSATETSTASTVRPRLLSFMKSCLRYEPEHRATCGELMEHEYFTEDGFVARFEGELADARPRRRRLQGAEEVPQVDALRGGDPNAEHRQAHAPPPPPPQQAQHHHAPPRRRRSAAAAAWRATRRQRRRRCRRTRSSLHHRGAPEPARGAVLLVRRLPPPPPPELPAEIAERRPATRGEGGGRRDEKEAPRPRRRE